MLDPLNITTFLHVGLGTLAVLAGAVALITRKGATHHIGAGRAFVVLMALTSGLGGLLGLVKAESLYITFHASILALTLIVSGWLTARFGARMGRAQILTGLINIINTAALIAIGVKAQSTLDGTFYGFAAEDYFFLAGMAGIVAIFDISLIFRRALSERHRIARHLWRMCLAFFIAAGSAFTGPGASAFSKEIQDSGLLSLPELIIILLMLFWLARTLFRRASTLPKTK